MSKYNINILKSKIIDFGTLNSIVLSAFIVFSMSANISMFLGNMQAQESLIDLAILVLTVYGGYKLILSMYKTLLSLEHDLSNSHV